MQKIFKFGTKNTLFWYFWVAILKICFHILKKNNFKMRPKMPFLGIVKLEFEKNYCHIWIQHPQIFQNANLTCKTKKLEICDQKHLA